MPQASPRAAPPCRLTEEEGGITLLRYEAKADVGGKLAQIGSRLVQGTSKKMADDFFGRFSEIVGGAEAPAAAPEAVGHLRLRRWRPPARAGSGCRASGGACQRPYPPPPPEAASRRHRLGRTTAVPPPRRPGGAACHRIR